MLRQDSTSPAEFAPLDTQRVQIEDYWKLARQGMILAIVIHAGFGLAAWLMGAMPLVHLQIVSIVVYAASYWLSLGRHKKINFLLAWLDLMVHSTIAAWILGSQSGFHYYSWILLPLLFTNPYRELSSKVRIAGVLCVVYLVIDWWLSRSTPVSIVSDTAIAAIRSFNLGCFLVATTVCAIFHARTILTAEQKLRAAADTDALTGLMNRRRMSTRMQQEWAKARSEHRPMAVMLLDIDHFKAVNDQFGHARGDEVIARVGDVLSRCVRRDDLVARWGGEEFLILMPSATELEAKDVAERMRREVASSLLLDERTPVSITIGVAVWHEGESLDQTIHRADTLLYRGKRNGRNCVVSEWEAELAVEERKAG